MDLLFLPISRQGGQFQSGIPGLWASEPPRRVNRHRAGERLVLHLTLEGNAPLTPEAFQQLLQGLTKSYYKNPGSVTAAMRSNAENLNQYMLDRNMRGSSRGVRAVGALTQVVVRRDTIYFAQSGLCHLFVLKNDRAVEFHDPKLSGRGLGVSRVPRVRYHQEKLEPNDHYLITAAPPPVWTTGTLKNISRMPLKGKYQRLIHRVEEDMEAGLLFFRKGQGTIRMITPVEKEGMGSGDVLDLDVEEDPGEAKSTPEPLTALRGLLSKKEAPPEPGRARADLPELQPETILDGDETAPETAPEGETEKESEEEQLAREEWTPEPETIEPTPPEADEWAPDLEAFEEDEEEEEIYPRLEMEAPPQPPSRAALDDQPLHRFLKQAASAVGKAARTVFETTAQIGRQIFPGEIGFDIPRWVMSLIAVAVPVIVVIVASVVYFDRGVDQQYTEAFERASMLYQQAGTVEEESVRFANLREAYTAVQEALQFKETEESLSLFEEIRTDLDEINQVTRLEFEPLFGGGLGNRVNITELVVDAYGDVYALDGLNGLVYRMISTAGYQVDPGFVCGPIEGEQGIGKLVDIVPLPKDFQGGAVILGIDAEHNMTFCYEAQGKSNEVFRDTSYSIPKGPAAAMTVSVGEAKNIYILDPLKEAIYIQYVFQQYSSGSEYSGEFDPPFMQDVVDLASNGSELYLLHEDGQVTRCTRPNPEGAADCVYPFMFSDDRPGMEAGPVLFGASFTALKLYDQLGTTLYMLDPEQQALYQFSTQLEYQGQYRPGEPLVGGAVTAFTFGKDNQILFAVGDQVYLAVRP